MSSRMDTGRVKDVFLQILAEKGSEDYTAGYVRVKAAGILDIDDAALKTREMRELLDEIIQAHFSGDQDGEDSLSDEDGENTPESDNEIEDELDSEGNPVDGIEPKAPSPKKRKVAEEKTPKPSKKPKTTKKVQKQQDQLARLKSYVFKCGVRKVWKRELDGLKEPEAIAKVEKILQELGMEGRPSLEKCKKIKEKREHDEEMKIIDESKILTTRLRRGKAPEEPVVAVPKITPKIDLSAFGDPESD